MKKGNRFKDRTGEKFITNEGYEVEIIEYFGAINCTIQYKDGIVCKNVFLSALKSGQVRKPYDRVGETYMSTDGYNMKIIEYFNCNDVAVILDDGNVIKNIKYNNLKMGMVSNPYHKSFCGVGYLGINSKDREIYEGEVYNKAYSTWANMIQRCHNEKELEKYPRYKNCTITEEWYSFKNFLLWFTSFYNHSVMKNWHLDKDIICPECKIYSPETSCLVPSEINTLILQSNSIRGDTPIGVTKRGKRFRAGIKKGNKRTQLGTYDTAHEAFQVYKEAKEAYIKEVAEKWKDKIDPRVYEALINYEVNIDD